jgi:hypothetical protein
MIRKLYPMLMLACFTALASNAQDKKVEIKRKIDKAIKDPKAKENSAKADAYIIKKKKIIADSSKIASKPEENPTKRKQKPSIN